MIALRAALKYLWYVLEHKWLVLLEGRKLAQPCGWWQLLVHDWTKVTPAEFWPYVRHFELRTPVGKRTDDTEFANAWMHHIRHTLHHWEAWITVERGTIVAHQIPERYVREMASDWLALARQRGNLPTKWYGEHREFLHLHPQTRRRVETLIGYREPSPKIVVTGTVACA